MVRKHPLIVYLSLKCPRNNGKSLKILEFHSEKPIYENKVQLICCQKGQKIDFFDGLYGRKWSEMIFWYYIYCQGTSEVTVYPSKHPKYAEQP